MNPSADNSDAARTARPLKHAQTLHVAGPVSLHAGGVLPAVDIAYETYGQLNAHRDNAVLICHALSGDSHVAAHVETNQPNDPADDPGWWDIAVGPGKAIDTSRWFVICANVLGGCRGTTGPNSVNPDTGRRYGAGFPDICVEDMVDVQRLLIDHLNIDQLLAVVGGSLGGHQALCWATRYPDRLRSCVALATSPQLTAQALAFDVVGRNAILRDPHFYDGQYYDQPHKPDVGLALARMLGHITYLSQQAMTDKFQADRDRPRDIDTGFEKQFSVGSYLAHQGDKFVERFDANSYNTLSLAMDRFDLGRTPEQLQDTLAKSTCRWLVVSYASDWLFPPFQSRQIVDALLASNKPVSYCNVPSEGGHDSFLLEDTLFLYGSLMTGFLNALPITEAQSSQSPPTSSDRGEPDHLNELVREHDPDTPTSIFHDAHLEHDRIIELIPQTATVLDLGCGAGGLLQRLIQQQRRRVVGVELDEAFVLASVQRGLDVIHADLNLGLTMFGDKQFDVVVLSQTLQTIVHTEAITAEILRVGRRCIVSFPNFGFHKVRNFISEQGRSPVAEGGILHYPWYATPNRRFLSVVDWDAFCSERNITVHQAIYLDSEAGLEVQDDPNLNADLAIYVISN